MDVGSRAASGGQRILSRIDIFGAILKLNDSSDTGHVKKMKASVVKV